MILTHGGQFSRELRGLTTHLICGRKSGGLKFEKATTKKDTLSVVTPDFVTQCIREKRLLPVDSFHPRLLVTPGDPIEAPERKKIHKKKLFNDTDATTAQQVPIQVCIFVYITNQIKVFIFTRYVFIHVVCTFHVNILGNKSDASQWACLEKICKITSRNL